MRLNNEEQPREITNAYILGAGFSTYGGLPLQKNFTKSLLNVDLLKEKGPSRATVRFLKKFVTTVYGQEESSSPMHWPSLEDVFTNIDLAANSGHHLSNVFSSADLRTVRRALIARIIRMLRRQYKKTFNEKPKTFKILEEFFSKINLRKSAFINMNWDTLVEEMIRFTNPKLTINYCCDALSAEISKESKEKIVLSKSSQNNSIDLVKMHGSVNWLYCDNCSQLYSFHPNKSEAIARQMLGQRDWNIIRRFIKETTKQEVGHLKCYQCTTILSTRIATFSYLKALDFPMFQKSWFSAETLLKNAKTWIFIGYSLPSADYEFKHLLKRVQLSKPTPPKIVVITSGDKTQETYKKFFGKIISFKKGITEGVITYLGEID